MAKKAVIFGSARTQKNEKDYKVAYELSKKLAQTGVDITTGGGPGIMEASNRGALDGGGKSYGYALDIKDQAPNDYCSEGLFFRCSDFQERKKLLMKEAGVFVIFPGGFGTLDELFEVLVHVHTKKIKLTPIFLYNKGFWNNLIGWFESELSRREMVEKKYDRFFEVVDSLDELFHGISNCFKSKLSLQ